MRVEVKVPEIIEKIVEKEVCRALLPHPLLTHLPSPSPLSSSS